MLLYKNFKSPVSATSQTGMVPANCFVNLCHCHIVLFVLKEKAKL